MCHFLMLNLKRGLALSALLSALLGVISASAQGTPTNHQGMGPLKPIPQLDLVDFLGTWHQIAKIPNRFEADCVSNTQAHYSISSRPGLVTVTNSCDDALGVKRVASGWARVETAPSVFSVTFFQLFGQPIFVITRNFWVIGMSKAKNYMVVGYPSRKFGWILARTTTLTQGELMDAQKILIEQGYNPCTLMLSRHTNAYPTEISLCEVTSLPF
jgi:apolipoprotein D and lipocalin family protein